jgi:hypothetical protein
MKKNQLIAIVKTKINKEKGFARNNKKMQTDFFETYFFHKHITRMVFNDEEIKNEKK